MILHGELCGKVGRRRDLLKQPVSQEAGCFALLNYRIVMSNRELSSVQKLITEGALLAALPALAHIFAFLYEHGYCSYFWLPSELIVISLTSTFVALGFILLVGLCFFPAE